jgi:hypothetical protein
MRKGRAEYYEKTIKKLEDLKNKDYPEIDKELLDDVIDIIRGILDNDTIRY